MRLSTYFSIFFLSCLPAALFAAADRVPKTVRYNKHDIKVTSYVVGSYNYLQRSNYFVSGVPDRVNDFAENGARLQQVFLAVDMLPHEGLGAYLETVAGYDAYIIAPNGWNANMLNVQNVGFAVRDAYLQYSFPSSQVLVGVVDAIAGFESFSYLEDTNFSHGIIFGYVVPGVHTGIRASHDVSDAVSLILGVTNSWTTIRHPTNINGVELGAALTLSKQLSMLVDAYLGNAYLTDFVYSGPTSRRILFDWYGTYNATEALSFNWNLDYAFQIQAALPYGEFGRATWAAAAGYVNYKLNDKWRTSVRAEVMNDGNGFRTGVPQVWKELTLSFGYAPIRHFEIIAETRHDISNVDAFVNKSGAATGPSQQSYSLSALYQIL